MDLSIVIPVFKGENTISYLLERITKNIDPLFSYEVIFVYDSGDDNSWEVIKQLKNKYPSIIRGLRLRINYGQQRATIVGIRNAKGDFIVTMDEDLQHNPEDIPRMIDKAIEGKFDIVYGHYNFKNSKFFRKIFSYIFKRIMLFLIPCLNKDYSPYRLIRARIAFGAINQVYRMSFIDEMLCKETDNCTSIMVTHNRRLNGNSSYSIFRLLHLSFQAIVMYSNLYVYIIALGLILLLLRFFGNVNSYSIYLTILSLLLLMLGFIMGLVRRMVYSNDLKGDVDVVEII